MTALNMAQPFQRSFAASSRVTAPADDSEAADRALLELGKELKARGYRFTTVTPASHQRVNARPHGKAPSLQDVFGWSRPFRRGDLAQSIVTRLSDAGALEPSGPLLRSNVRYATLGEQIFVHSAFPTDTPDAVFFGPDTYRFARMVRQSLAAFPARRACRIIDVGAGSGAGGLHAAALLAADGPTLVLTDINARALRYSRVNAALNGVPDVHTVESDLFACVDGAFDLIMSNPPYLVDPLARLYRHGGGELGFELSLKIVEQGIERLKPGGRLVLYTGSAIVDGVDAFHGAIAKMLAARGVRWAYEEIDPDVFGEELEHPPYDRADRIAVVGITIDAA
jgi:methylase of polypeptide subunit release factors